MLVKQINLFFDGGVTIAIAIEHVACHGDGAEFINCGGEANLYHFGFGEVTVGDMGGH